MNEVSKGPFPLLVTGLAGVAGYNAFHHFRRWGGDSVRGVRRADNWPLRGPGIVGCDLHDRDRLEQLFKEHRFAAVLNTEGTCALKSCELDPLMAWRVNVLGVQNLLEVLSQQPHPVRLVHLSIDLVYSGTGQGDHREEDPTDPVTVYGKTMVQTERLVLDAMPDACVLRISLPMGVSFNGHAGAIDWIQSRFKQGKPATLYYDEIRTPTYTDCLNEVLTRTLNEPINGLYHAGGPLRMSLYQIAQIVNRVGGYPPELLQGCFRQEAGPMPPRAGNVSLNSSKLADTLGHSPFAAWPAWESLRPDGPEWHCRRDGFRGSPQMLAQVLYQNPLRKGPCDHLKAR